MNRILKHRKLFSRCFALILIIGMLGTLGCSAAVVLDNAAGNASSSIGEATDPAAPGSGISENIGTAEGSVSAGSVSTLSVSVSAGSVSTVSVSSLRKLRMMESCAESSTVFSAMIRLIVSSGMNMVARYL